MIWSIAWKNVWRNKLRSLVVIVAVTLGILAGVFSAGFMNGLIDKRIRAAINKELAHVQVHDAKYMENREIKYTIEDVDKLVTEIEALPEVLAVSKRIKFESMIRSSRKSSGVIIYGIEPEKEKQISTIYENICDSCGSYFEDKSRYKPMVISKKLAEELKIRLHKKPVISFQTAGGEMSESKFKIMGVFETKNSVFDKMSVFVKYDDLAPLMEFAEGEAHELAIMLNKTEDCDIVAAKLKETYSNYSIMTWKEIAPELGMMVDFLDLWLYIFVIIILLALGFGIVNTMLMVVLERVKELGMLMAVGMNKWKLFKMITLESVFLSITGGIVGMLGAAALIWYTGMSGINFEAYAEGLEKLGYDTLVYPKIGLDYYLGVGILVVATGILASLYPARKALKLNPSDAIRTEM